MESFIITLAEGDLLKNKEYKPKKKEKSSFVEKKSDRASVKMWGAENKEEKKKGYKYNIYMAFNMAIYVYGIVWGGEFSRCIIHRIWRRYDMIQYGTITSYTFLTCKLLKIGHQIFT